MFQEDDFNFDETPEDADKRGIRYLAWVMVVIIVIEIAVIIWNVNS